MINKAEGNEHAVSINKFSHYSLFPGLLILSPAFLCILHPFLGLSFCHIPNNLSNYNVLTANAPFIYQISGTWSNHEGSILSWCWISSLYGFLLCYRGRPKSHNVSKRGGPRETLLFSFVSNFVRNSQLAKEKRMSSFLHLARDDKERVSSIDEQRNDVVVGIALFFFPFLLASFDPFVLNFFVWTEPLAESKPVLQDPILAIHPPCIYAGDIASAMGFGLCRSKMLNGLVARHSPPMRNDAAEKNGTLLRSAGCVRSQLLKFKGVGTTTSSLCWTAGASTVASCQEVGGLIMN
ncbi:hypothetical protein MKW94_013371 [Papaver nudicaule]|uniref:Cytochrome c assembly protein domain-containing protein n=1 Tax=Papaver nudicaule TaxID=74823 RepID=A0AA41SIS3_PAPNU|nr:hypothetical protein [Papaver nudicaule]